MQRSKAARSEATRAELVATAARLYAEHGYAGVGTEEIVRQAGVTRASSSASTLAAMKAE